MGLNEGDKVGKNGTSSGFVGLEEGLFDGLCPSPFHASPFHTGDDVGSGLMGSRKTGERVGASVGERVGESVGLRVEGASDGVCVGEIIGLQ